MPTASFTCLLIEDDPSFSEILRAALVTDCQWTTASSLEAATRELSLRQYDLVVLDLGLPDGDGLTLLPLIAQRNPEAQTIIVSMSKHIERVVAAIKDGAADYVTKDLGITEVVRVIRKALTNQIRNWEILGLRSEVSDRRCSLLFSEASPRMARVMELIRQVAPLPTTVLIEGESGTGKELVAQELHSLGPSGDGPFISVNLAAIPGDLVESTLFGHERGSFTSAHQQRIGKLELAGGGTLFLDEIGCAPLDIQVKLLRVIQEREFERVGGNRGLKFRARIVAATHRDLAELVAQGGFREDLYYRLRVYPISLPPLRDRPEQIQPLVRHFLHSFLTQFSKPIVDIEADAMELLRQYRWPGNVRELENLAQRLAVLNRGDPISIECLPQEISQLTGPPTGMSLREQLARLEREVLETVLVRHGGNQRLAAEELQIPLSTLKFKLRRSGLSSVDIRKTALRTLQQ